MADISVVEQVQYRFSADTPYGRYTDALYYPPDAVPEQSVIDAAIQARVDAWVYAIEHPPVVEEPEPEWTVVCEDGEIVDA
jgi:hypothetical protein